MIKLISTGVAISATSRKDSRHCWLCYRRMFSSLLVIAFDRLVPFSTLTDTGVTRPDVMTLLTYSYQIIREGLILLGLLLIGRSINGIQSRTTYQ